MFTFSHGGGSRRKRFLQSRREAGEFGTGLLYSRMHLLPRLDGGSATIICNMLAPGAS